MRKKSVQENNIWVGDTICWILTSIYVQHRERFEIEAAHMGVSVEQLAAASIIGMLDEATGAANRRSKR